MSQGARSSDGLVGTGIVGVLLFAPLPFGSVFPWAQAVLEVAVAGLVGLCALRALGEGKLVLRRTPLLLPGFVMIGLVLLQLVRPGGSANLHATWSSFRLLVASVGFLFVLAVHLRTWERVHRVVSVVIAWGVALAALGLVNLILGRHVVLWFPKETEFDRLTSSFINANHQAFYFFVLLFLALGMLLRPRGEARHAGAEGRAATGRASTHAGAGRVLLVGATVILGLALVLTLSRGALASTLVGLLAVLWLSWHGRRGRGTALALGSGITAFGIYAVWVGLGGLLARFSGLVQEPFADLRWALWEAAIRMTAEAPVLGVGLGAFADVFPRYRPTLLPSGAVLEYAHNDYLQLLVETGLAGVGVLVWGMVHFTVFVYRRWAARRDPFVRGLTLGGFGALVAVVVHSAIDFSLHMPANALLVVLVSGLLPAVVTSRSDPGREWADADSWRWSLAGRGARVAVAAAGMGAVVAAAVSAAAGLSDWHVQRASTTAGRVPRSEGAVGVGQLAAARDDLVRARRFDPWNASAQAGLAIVTDSLAVRVWNYGITPDGRRLPGRSSLERLRASHELFASAYAAYARGVALRPRASDLHDRFAWFLGQLEQVRLSVRGSGGGSWLDPRLVPLLDSGESLIPQALAHLDQAVSWDPKNAYRHRSLALFALAHRFEGFDRARVVEDSFREALRLDPSLLRDTVDRVLRDPGGEGFLRGAVPAEHGFLLALGKEFERRELWVAAQAAYEAARALAANPSQEAEVHLTLGRLRLREKNAAAALGHARQALVLLPKSPEVFDLLAGAYSAAEDWPRAEVALASAASLAAEIDAELGNVYRGRLADLLSARGDAERALLVRREILRSAPNDPWAHFHVGRLLARRGDASGALQAYRSAEGLAGRDWRIHREVGDAYARGGLLRESAAAYDAALGLNPDAHDVRADLARLYERIGQPRRAAEHYRYILARRPGHEGAKRGLDAVTAGSPARSSP